MPAIQSPPGSASGEQRVFPLRPLPPRGGGGWCGEVVPSLSLPLAGGKGSVEGRGCPGAQPPLLVVAAGAHAVTRSGLCPPLCVWRPALAGVGGRAAPETDEGVYLTWERGLGKPGLGPPRSLALGSSRAGPLNCPSPTPSVCLWIDRQLRKAATEWTGFGPQHRGLGVQLGRGRTERAHLNLIC